MSDVAVAKNLRAAGFTQEQAETLAESISGNIDNGATTKLELSRIADTVATKLDLAELKTEVADLKARFNDLAPRKNARLSPPPDILSSPPYCPI